MDRWLRHVNTMHLQIPFLFIYFIYIYIFFPSPFLHFCRWEILTRGQQYRAPYFRAAAAAVETVVVVVVAAAEAEAEAEAGRWYADVD